MFFALPSALTVQTNLLELTERLGKHIVLATALSLAVDTDVSTNAARILLLVQDIEEALYDMVTSSITHAIDFGSSLITKAVSDASGESNYDKSLPSITTGMCSFIRNIIDGDWIQDCFSSYKSDIDVLVIDPTADLYLPIGFEQVEYEAFIQLLQQPLTVEYKTLIMNYLTGLENATNEAKVCSGDASDKMEEGYQAVKDASALESTLGRMINGVLRGIELTEQEISAAEQCLSIVDEIIPGASELSGIANARSFLNQGYSVTNMINSAKGASLSSLGFTQKMKGYVAKWI